jgi:hypothetical protein
MITLIQGLLFVALQSNLLVQDSVAHPVFEDSSRVYKVIDIDKTKKKVHGTNKAYIILIQDTASKQYYTIITVKTSPKTSEKIKKGEAYHFSLTRYFEHDYIIHLGVKLNVVIDGLVINIPMNNYTGNIYTTANLTGIYYHYP